VVFFCGSTSAGRTLTSNSLAVVFDLDGTLLDVEARHHHVYSSACRELGGVPLDRAEYWQLRRQRAGSPDILARSGITGDRYTAFETAFQAQIELPESLGFDVLFPDVIPLLAKVSAVHGCVLVAQRAAPVALQAQLAVLGVTPYFQAIETAPSHSEPAFQVKAGLIRKAVHSDMHGVVIGDTEADVMAATALRYQSIAVASGTRDRDILEQQEPDHLVDDLSGVEHALHLIGAL